MLTSICYDMDLPLTTYLFFSFWFSLLRGTMYMRAYIYLQVCPLAFLLLWLVESLPVRFTAKSPSYKVFYETFHDIPDLERPCVKIELNYYL